MASGFYINVPNVDQKPLQVAVPQFASECVRKGGGLIGPRV